MCATTTTTTTASKEVSGCDDPAKAAAEEELEAPPPYTLREHCRHLYLKTEHTSTHSYWYCDWTSRFVEQHHSDLLKDVVRDYCQPFQSLAELQDLYVGISSLSPHTEDPLPVRTVSLQLRPDAHHYQILQAVHQSFTTLHKQDYYIVKSTPQTFQAIGANGSAPYFVSAFVGVHQQSLEHLWLHRHPALLQ